VCGAEYQVWTPFKTKLKIAAQATLSTLILQGRAPPENFYSGHRIRRSQAFRNAVV
jgi:hypothetical protein